MAVRKGPLIVATLGQSPSPPVPLATEMKQRFAEFLQRVDGKQSLVDDFAGWPS